jgi:uncharacterized protein (TIGR02145 family)
MKTKNRIWLCPLIMVLVLILVKGCKKDEDSAVLKDTDGNGYTSVTIGTQVWIVENLRTTKYNDGTSIPNVADEVEWVNLTTGAYCWYDNDISYKADYGALYNWYAVGTGKLCPTGWHVPTHEEWEALHEFLGGYYNGAGKKLRETGTAHWGSPNEATNETGFTGLPGGYRTEQVIASFLEMGKVGEWWSATGSTSSNNAYYWYIGNSAYLNNSAFKKQAGRSVRCLKD